jgi:hypothetical protein
MCLSSVRDTSSSSVKPLGMVEESPRSRRSIKRAINYCEEDSVLSLEEEVERVSAKAIKGIKLNAWTREDKEILRLAVEKFSRRCNKVSFARIAKDPDVYGLLGRTSKQLREKWVNNLCLDFLGGGSIQESHKLIIERLYNTHPRKWQTISEKFADIHVNNKPAGKYYSGNAIKNYFNSSGWKKIELQLEVRKL